MKEWKLGMATTALLAVCGCMQGTPGGPGVQAPSNTENHTTNKPVTGDAKDTFSLRLPMLSTSVKQGETKSATISIQRGTGFDQDVRLSFSEVPNGVTITPMDAVIQHSEQDVKVDVMASESAALGDFKVKVVGHADKGGPDAVNELKLTVSAK